MKRMNFTFLLLFALLSFATSNLSAQQSSSCIDVVNITVDADGGFEVNPAVLGATGPAYDAISINYGTGSSTALAMTGSGFSGTGNVRSLFGSCESGTTQYELYANGNMVCWGKINFEVKIRPVAFTTIDTIICGEDGPDFSKAPYRLSDIEARVNGTCTAKISNLTIEESFNSDKCGGSIYTRTVYGSISIDGNADKIQIQTNSVYLLPIYLGDVVGPEHDGGTSHAQIGMENTVHIECGVDTDPASIEEYYTKVRGLNGIRYASPFFIGREVIDSITSTTIETVTLDTVEQMVMIDDKWVLADVVTKDTVSETTIDTFSSDNLVPIREGVQCNLSTKFTDMYFAGCVGDESKIMRTWQIVDWCSGSTVEYMQWIIVHDTKAPVYKAGLTADMNYYAPIAPWVCSASMRLPVPIFEDDCSDYTLFYTIYNGDGGTISGDYITDLWISDCDVEVYVTATDACGNEATKYFYVHAYDDVEPVAIATDQVNVSLTDSEEDGIAKVYKQSIDAGSHDAGCGEVQTCVLLKEELDNPIVDYYGDLVFADNNHTYHAAQCHFDGEIKVHTGFTNNGKTKTYSDYAYVICKDYVKFCCDDVFVEEDQNYQQVALVVTDQALYCDDDTNNVLSAHPNVSHSWTNVKVEDKTGAAWGYVIDETSCAYTDEFDPNEPTYGGIICNSFYVSEISREEEVQCGYGIISVTWGAYTDDSKEVLISSKTYEYDVNLVKAFDPYEIKWPKHYDGSEYDGVYRECEDVDGFVDSKGSIAEYATSVPMGDAQDCALGEDTGGPVWCNTSCGLIGSSYEIDTVTAYDACYKLIKRWTIIDWCTWEPNGDYTDDANDSYDEFQAVDDEWMTEAGYADALTSVEIDSPECEDCEKPSGDAYDIYFRYTDVDEDGYYTFDQVIKIIDDLDPEVTVADSQVDVTDGNAAKSDDPDYSGCVGSADITASVTDMCGETDLSAVGASWWVEITLYDVDGDVVDSDTETGTGATMTVNTLDGEPGWYSEIKWRAKDGCGNTGYAESLHDFVDTKNPTPVCIQDLSTTAMNTDGSVAIWASDYDLGSFDNCSDVEVYFKDVDGNKVASLSFTCENLGPNELQMYVSDDSGNEDYCFVTLRIDDNTGVCGGVTEDGAAAIKGEVATAFGDMVESAEVALSAGAKSATSIEGKYAFNNTAANNEYQVRAKKDDDYMNGVSTLDLVLIQKHVLGLQTLDSPYKVIAADINSDERISAIDLVELRKLILGIYADLPNNDSWRFIDADQSFDEPTSPFPFAEQLSVSLGTDDVAGKDFVAAKIGDVSGNAIANSAIAAEGRSLGSVKLQIADATVEAGQLVNVAVSANAFNDVAAYQFTMDVAGLEFVSVTSGAVEMTEGNFGILDDNTITAAWYNTTGVTTEDALFTVTFRATSTVTLSNAIALSSRVTKSEAYTASAERLDLGLEFSSKKVSTFALYQNEPNPFNDATVISFELPEAGQATLNVFDVTGKTVLVRTENFAKGSNKIELRKAELNTTGVMYYQLESGDFIATKKMILID